MPDLMLPKHVCDVADCEQGFDTMAEVVAHERGHAEADGVYVREGWWHPNTNAGRVHDHPQNPGRGWSEASHRLCEPVYTRRAP